MKRKKQAILSQANVVIRLSDITSPVIYRIALAHIKHNGFYAYTKAETNQKIFVQP
jgi:hypothetical protein